MKKFVIAVVLAGLGSASLSTWIHWHAIHEASLATSRFETLFQRKSTIDGMTLSLERYRRLSSNFRKSSNAEVFQAKSQLRESFQNGVKNLNELAPTAVDTEKTQNIQSELANLMKLSDKLEPNLFSRDAYFRPETRDLHDTILSLLSRMSQNAETRIQQVRTGSSLSADRSIKLILLIGVLMTALLCFILVREFFNFDRPLRRLHRYANDLQAGMAEKKNGASFHGYYGDIQSAMNRMASAIENFAKERHKFVQDVIADLKTPLALLQTGRFLSAANDESKQLQAAESVRRGLAILSGSLEDLSDIENINRLDTLLNEKVVDLSELVSDVTRTLAGTGAAQQIQTAVPSMPVWANLDSRRMERVLIQCVTKVAATIPVGGKVLVSVTHNEQSAGIEIAIQNAAKPDSMRSSSGPEIELLRHWVSEGGLSMTLAYKLMKALGGSVVASGMPGTSARIVLRLPRARVVNRGLISAPSSLQAGLAQPSALV